MAVWTQSFVGPLPPCSLLWRRVVRVVRRLLRSRTCGRPERGPTTETVMGVDGTLTCPCDDSPTLTFISLHSLGPCRERRPQHLSHLANKPRRRSGGSHFGVVCHGGMKDHGNFVGQLCSPNETKKGEIFIKDNPYIRRLSKRNIL